MNQEFIESIKQGKVTCCPTCGRHAQVYRRTVTRTMAVQLHKAAMKTKSGEYIHTSELVIGTSTGDFPKLKYWKLIAPRPHQQEDGSKKDSGWWTVTERGRQFIDGLIMVRNNIHIYNDTIVGMSGGYSSFTDCLGKDFDYSELRVGQESVSIN